ncbi:hypothetical protein RCO28_36405 [Streptomyces sp. LHD-70]|uniref:hypothetical protein n=1 Tax=Streptomyces sp. LHD-70 TaxID=3072140 RepID=UPI00280C4BED|nr:hypothetical protein [Streptomyces sp. LHD-70]MDQ8707911.1 hypothetical protein [Streptomyces sp. LHD-70]
MPTVIEMSPLFELCAKFGISSCPEGVCAVVSDLPRSAEWSPEGAGGEWISG